MAELKRVLGFWTALALAISSIIGTGMFFSISIGSQLAGNGVILAWALLTLIGLYIASFFGELTAMFPKAGGIYEFSKQAYSRFTSFMIGWTAWFVGNLGVALTVVAAIDYIIPGQNAWLLKLAICIAFIILLNVIAYVGIESSAFILVIFAVITVSLIVSVIIPGAFQLHPGNFSPFLAYGTSSVLLAIFFISESFFGWESVTYLAEETKNPERTIPKALLIGTVIVGVLGTLLTFVSLGVMQWQFLAEVSAPLSFVVQEVYGAAAVKVFAWGIFVVLLGAAAGGIITMPRLLLALARDKLFITQFAAIHPRYNTPYKAIIFQTIVSILVFLMAFGRYEQLLSLVLPIGFILYFFTIIIVLKLRFTMPNRPRPFRAPFAAAGTILLSLFFAGMVVFWVAVEPGAWGILGLALSFILLGMPIYLLLEMYYDPDEIIRINDFLAYFTLLFENFILPKNVRAQILSLLGEIKGKSVLEFGCSVGTLTTTLAEHVKPRGRVFATDLSKREILITRRRLYRKGHYHVVVLHDEHQVNRVHPQIPNVDAIVSIGMMGYMQDIKKVLKEMYDLLPYGGRIVFLDYADFFKLIPNVQWLSDDKVIARMFREAGFSVFVKREKGLFWSYVYVYGIKYEREIPYV